VHATVYGMVVTGALLGLLGGVIFAFVGLPGPVLWGSVMAVFAILPVLGIPMIWIPAAGWLALNGEWGGVTIVTITFTLLSIADSMIYPYLVGSRMRMHTAIAFVAAIGGLLVFGPVGFVIGPMVIALMIALRDIRCARAKPVAVPGHTLSGGGSLAPRTATVGNSEAGFNRAELSGAADIRLLSIEANTCGNWIARNEQRCLAVILN